MSLSHIPSFNVNNDSSVNEGTPKTLKGKNIKAHTFIQMLLLVQGHCRIGVDLIKKNVDNISFNVYPLSFAMDDRF